MSLPNSQFEAYVVERDENRQIQRSRKQLQLGELPEGEVLIEAEWSSLNYKDALAATGHPGVVRRFPHVPGIDVAGVIRDSSVTGRPHPSPGREVIVTGYDLGAGRWGGWSNLVRVPGEWVVPRPDGLTLREAMILGTAGFTAALCVDALIHHGVSPDSGEVVVTGATGGVGCLAVMLLAKLGYRVAAVTGKAAWHDKLQQWGASEIISRDAVVDSSDKPLLAARWAGVVDTVGGATLATLIRQTDNGGCVAACGLVGGSDLALTVYPFILRGVTLAGIDSAWCPKEKRIAIWNKLASEWRLEKLEHVAVETTLAEIDSFVTRILAGEIAGRTIVNVASRRSQAVPAAVREGP